MSPLPTRLNRQNADDVERNVCWIHPNVSVQVWRFTGDMGRTQPDHDMGRTQPDHDIGIDLQNARTKTATGSLTNTLLVQGYERGKA
jgi:hypothetical protein